MISTQTSCGGRPCEGFVLTQGAELPALEPVQLRLYSGRCGAPASGRKALAAAGMPHEQLAQVFSVLASGPVAEAKVLYVEETGMHPRGEHVLGEIYKKGVQALLVRCGPVYTASTNNWYSLKGASIHPVMLRQSMSYDGNQVGNSYELRLDNTLPKRDARDQDPGVGWRR